MPGLVPGIHAFKTWMAGTSPAMTVEAIAVGFPDLVPALSAQMPKLRGRMIANQKLADVTWFRVGGPAQILFTPADEEDLAYFLSNLAPEIPVTVIGLGSNLLVRDGGVEGVVIRLARGFNEVTVEGDRVKTGTAVPDVKVSRAAADAGLAGLAFYRGVPGAIGGALRMNAGAYGRETKDALLEARGGSQRQSACAEKWRLRL